MKAAFMGTLKLYYKLTKPGIIRGNVMTAIAGFLLASKGSIDVMALLLVASGISCVIASACVLNNYIDRNIDRKMSRTKNRALAIGAIPLRNALYYAVILSIVGFTLLSLINGLVVFIGIIGLFSYVVLYGYYKRNSVHGTLIGSISGSTSLVAGYCAVSGNLDLLAILLFIIMALWQMPHFYAIGIYKKSDYEAASLPILPVKHGIAVTKKHNLVYIILFSLAALSLSFTSNTGYTYLIVMGIVCALWLRVALDGMKLHDDIKYGHKIFGQSLITLLVFSVMISVDHFLP